VAEVICGNWHTHRLLRPALVVLGRAPDPALVGNLSHALTDAMVAGSVLWYHWFLVMCASSSSYPWG